MAMTKTAALDKTKVTSILNNLLKQFQQLCNRPNQPSESDLEEFLASDFQLTNNGKLASKSLADHMNRIMKFQKKFSKIEVTSLLEEPIVSGNKAAFRYNCNLTPRNGQKLMVNFMVMATFEDNKIAQWLQVSHQQNTGDWDA